jgi:aspartate aminotransferase-like enzyme
VQEQNLRIPGPTPLPPQVREAMARQMINHRGPEYAAIQAEVLEGLRHFFRTEHEVLLITGSGTGGLEAAIVNTLSPGEPVLAVSIGVFGDRFARIAEAYGAQVRKLDVPWGQAVTPDALAASLASGPAVRAVLLTCNETSTGAMNDLATLAPVIHAAPGAPLLLVDAISALGAIDLPMDSLGIDVLITGSQKAWMAPPGTTMLGVSPRAWEAHARARMPRFYWDFSTQRQSQQKGQSAWTPDVVTVIALQVALRMMRDEGREAIFARHARVAAFTQRGLEDIGLSLFAAPGCRSRTVTAATVPDGVDTSELLRYARTERGVVIAGGQDRLAGRMIRLGHMGWVDEPDISPAIEALAEGLARQGFLIPTATGA